MQCGRLIHSLAFAGAILAASSSFAAAKCELGRVAELPITMRGLRPTIATRVNGKEASFVLDSGAFFTTVTSSAASELDLILRHAPQGFYIQGIGGSYVPQIGKAKEFTLAGVTLRDVEFFVGGSDPGTGVGLLGQNLLANYDVEYDLGNGVMRLFHSNGCEQAVMAYWVRDGQAFSWTKIDEINIAHAQTVGVGYLNGQQIKIAFDTGAPYSLLSTKAAETAGVKLDSDGVTAAGYTTGVGAGEVKSYIARFDTLKIGEGEEIKNARLRIANFNVGVADMLLGADFFISHRIFVSNREHKMYLTYNGGPIFDLTQLKRPQPDAIPQESTTAQSAPATDTEAADAAELARKGSAMVTRHEFGPGLQALSKAIELSPSEPEYYFQRANAYWANQQPDRALADFDQVNKLKEGFLPAYVPRAQLRLAKGNTAEAMAILDRADSLAPMTADLRYALGIMYDRLDRTPDEIREFGLWLLGHPNDARFVAALGMQCFAEALQNVNLREAGKDCEQAMARGDKSNPDYGVAFIHRALLRIRLGKFDQAIADSDDALKRLPNNALALYLRAVAESRKGMKSQSDADLAAATKAVPTIGDRFEHHAISP